MEQVLVDSDLTPILSACSDEDLIPLRDYILKASTNELESMDSYIAQPDHPSTYVDEMVYEIQTFGGNTFANFFRNGGIPYAEVAYDVARRVKAKHDENASVQEIEWAILTKILEGAIENISQKDREQLEQVFREAGARNVDLNAGVPLSLIITQIGIRASGFVPYQLATIVANAVAKKVLGQGLKFAANAALTRSIGVLAGPIGWLLTGGWLIFDAAGPAYRITIPCVCHVAYLRLKSQYSRLELAGED